jgi:hypothetical protein
MTSRSRYVSVLKGFQIFRVFEAEGATGQRPVRNVIGKMVTGITHGISVLFRASQIQSAFELKNKRT